MKNKMAEDAKGYQFFRYRQGDPPYRRTPDGIYHQFRPDRGVWTECNQNADRLTPIKVSQLPKDVRARATERSVVPRVPSRSEVTTDGWQEP